MAARAGDWTLVGEASDPIVADVPALEELVRYYQTLADQITTEADTLGRIGDGDESQFKGEAADKVRSKSKEVAASLRTMSGRYDAVRDALTTYRPELEHALDESAAALRDAGDASAAGSRGSAMPDPSVNRASDAPPLTADETGQVDARNRAIANAHSASDAATARLRSAVDGLTAAGRQASSTIREAWHDGLHDTLGDKIKAFFAKLLKIIVKIFTYIGIALAALAILIPGLGFIALAAAVATTITFVANIALAAMGEGSWLDVIMSAVSVAFVGAGALVTKAASIAKAGMLTKGMPGVEKLAGTKIVTLQAERMAAIRSALSPSTKIGDSVRQVQRISQEVATVQKELSIAKSTNVIGKFREKADWFDPRSFRQLASEDRAKIAEGYSKGYRWDRLFGVDRQQELAEMRTFLKSEYGVAVSTVPKWHAAFQATRVTYGWGNIVFGQSIKPTGWGSDQGRVPAYDDASAALRT
ncbi:hypothetical protein [Curtobacterium sp. Leaf261]|uniref:hypothetical protein n=1 Tax=Curtobacterium sp. Leaf261 TaxID=1736311 RepID=UPI0006F84A52|nr:hypothetical protein [Curtobacterium sp. Leaf261]KQO63866.1 hypothetical protein ASF23_06695 [Curtobacterium sp. Leaf261]